MKPLWSALGASLLASVVSCAPPPPPRFGAETTLMVIDTDNPARPMPLEVRPVGEDRVVAACETAPCRFRLPEGGYRLTALGIGDTSGRSRWVDLRRPTRITLSPGSSTERVGGLAMGVVGPLMFATGLFVSMLDRCESIEAPNEKCSKMPSVMMVSGVVFTFVGWILFADGKTRISEPQTLDRRSRTDALFTF